MMPPGWPEDGTPSVESLRELRLRALLNDLVKDLGLGKAAEQFGVDRKTLWRWQRAAELPPRLAETLERMLLQRALAAMEEDRETVRAVEERVSEMGGQLAAATAGTWTAWWPTPCGGSSRRRCSGWSGGWTSGGARHRMRDQAVRERAGPGPSGVTPTW